MPHRRPRLIFIALMLALLGSPAAAQAIDPPAQPDGAIEVGADAISDLEIRQRIDRVLGQIDGYDNVTVTVASGVVTLSGDVLDGTAEDELLRIVGRVEGVVTIENDIHQSADLNARLAPAVDRVLQRGEDVLVNAPIYLVALSVLLAISAGGWLLTRRLRLWHRLAPNPFIADIYRAVARIGFVVLGIVVALDILNATALLGAVLGAAGVVGLAVGFAVRDTVENFIASILLSLRQPFRPNDYVEIDGVGGSVARLTSRATILISPDGNHIRIPNATVFKGRIVNFTRDPNRRFTFTLGVGKNCDLAAALTTAVNALDGLNFVLTDPPVAAWIENVGDSNVILTFAGWVNQRETDFAKARGEAIRVAKNALEAGGFALPDPTYRLHLEGQPAVPGLQPGPRPEPARPTHATDTPLPEAAEPEGGDLPIDDAVQRERELGNETEDLLSTERKSE